MCDCPDFGFRHKGEDAGCKHARTVVATGLIEMPPVGARRVDEGHPRFVERRRRVQGRTLSEEDRRVLLERPGRPVNTEAY